jgi:hypothetical protein
MVVDQNLVRRGLRIGRLGKTLTFDPLERIA